MPKRKSDEMKREVERENVSLLTDSDEDIFGETKPKTENEKIKDDLIGSSDEDKKPKKVKINRKMVILFESIQFNSDLWVLSVCPIPTPTSAVDVLAVLDFEILCFRPENPSFHPRPLFPEYEGHDETKDLRND